MRVIVVDDSMLIREGLARLLEDAGITVLHRLADTAALEAIVALDHPDVVIVDIRMPPSFTDEGLVAAEMIRLNHPDVGALVLSQHVEADYALRLIEKHPQRTGYLLKDRLSDIGVLLDALRRVAAGEVVIDPTVIARMVGRKRQNDVLAQLSRRERDVLALVAQGLTNEAIGRRLFIGDRTVESHVTSAMHKLAIDEQGGDGHRRVLAVLAFLRHAS